MQVKHCPSHEQLFAFSFGKITADELDTVAAHLETCATCAATLQNLSNSADTLVSQLAQPVAADTFAEESACAEAVQKICDLADEVDPSQTQATVSQQIPDLLGNYELRNKIGEGGMGAVYKAWHTLLEREVALKVVAADRLQDKTALDRFRREIAAAGRLDHPNIVRASDANQDEDVQFLVMDWIDGQDLAQRVKADGPQPVTEACRIIRQAALGLQHAHDNGLVHRDVKPSNIMTTTDGQVKVLDLGLALLLDRDADTDTVTAKGQVMGTFDFLAPEQAKNAHEADYRADIYSLGCTLYFLLTGRAPFADTKNNIEKLCAHQVEESPPLANHRPDIPAEVQAIVSKMMAKDPAARHADMTEVADTLAPFTHAAATRLKRYHPKWAFPAACAAVVVFAALCAAVVFYWRTPNGTLEIRVSEPNVQIYIDGKEKLVLLSKKFGRIEMVPGPHKLMIKRGDEILYTTSFKLERGKNFSLEAIWQPKLVKKGIAIPPAGGSPFDALRREDISAYELAIAGRGDAQRAPKEVVAIWGDSRLKHSRPIYDIAVSPDGDEIVSVATDHSIRFWDRGTGKEKAVVFIPAPNNPRSVAYSPDGKLVATGTSNSIIVWERASLRQLYTKNQLAMVNSVAFSPNGKLLTAVVPSVGVMVWEAETGTLKHTWKCPADNWGNVVFSPDGQHIAVSMNKLIQVFDVTTKKERFSITKGLIRTDAIRYSPDGSLLLSFVYRAIRKWDAKTGQDAGVIVKNHDGGFSHDIAMSNDGKYLATVTADRIINLWDVKQNKKLFTLSGHAHHVSTLAFTPDGKQLVSGGNEGSIREWDVATGQDVFPTDQHRSGIIGVVLSADEHRLTTVSKAGEVRAKNVVTGKTIWTRHLLDQKWGAIQVTASNSKRNLIAAYGTHGDNSSQTGFSIWNSNSGREVFRKERLPYQVVASCFSPNGKYFALGCMESDLKGKIRLWETNKFTIVAEIDTQNHRPRDVSFNSDGTLLSSTTLSETIT